MRYTSTKFHGQVYIPVANWLLMIGTIIVTAVYNNTTSLGNAYGTCVILVTFITTSMIASHSKKSKGCNLTIHILQHQKTMLP
jgi:KUP system potassium uptake protein